jgi:CheY-like chemotaxis protein
MRLERESARRKRPEARRYTILVVEDEALIRLVAAERLRESGYAVLEAASASEAMELLNTGAPIDAVFSDVYMQGDLTGFDLARWVRDHFTYTPILLASANACNFELRDADGEFEIFAKPYDLAQIARRIHALIRESLTVVHEPAAPPAEPREGSRQSDRMRDSYVGLARMLRAHHHNGHH